MRTKTSLRPAALKLRLPECAAAMALCAGAMIWATPARACWYEVGNKYGISPELLYAIAKTESSLNPAAINRSNKNGSYDVGLMQINSQWFPKLRTFGITERHLYDPCVNMEVGAWILAQNMQRHGYSWNAVGAYNAVSPDRRLVYVQRVYRNLPSVSGTGAPAQKNRKPNQWRNR